LLFPRPVELGADASGGSGDAARLDRNSQSPSLPAVPSLLRLRSAGPLPPQAPSEAGTSFTFDRVPSFFRRASAPRIDEPPTKQEPSPPAELRTQPPPPSPAPPTPATLAPPPPQQQQPPPSAQPAAPNASPPRAARTRRVPSRLVSSPAASETRRRRAAAAAAVVDAASSEALLPPVAEESPGAASASPPESSGRGARKKAKRPSDPEARRRAKRASPDAAAPQRAEPRLREEHAGAEARVQQHPPPAKRRRARESPLLEETAAAAGAAPVSPPAALKRDDGGGVAALSLALSASAEVGQQQLLGLRRAYNPQLSEAALSPAARRGRFRTLLMTHIACLGHDTLSGHLETPARLEAVLRALAADEFVELEWRSASAAAPLEDLFAAHDARYLSDLWRLCELVESLGFSIPSLVLDPPCSDTVLSRGSREAMLAACGAVTEAVDAVMRGEACNAFVAVRPPGHHAERSRAMGFCLLNHVAIGALHASRVHGAQRVAVVDIDTHHGNGTQDILETDERFLYVSVHRANVFPHTGLAHECGRYRNVMNLPVASRVGFVRTAGAIGLLLREFAPQLVLVSAGFDAHEADFAEHSLQATEADFAELTECVLAAARECCGRRVVSVLEGGYNVQALARCCALHVKQLMAEADAAAREAAPPPQKQQ
jgi:acetoin utilization deacetylase AcuC-like enzyme